VNAALPGRNASDSEVVLLALGSPRDSDDVRVPRTCPACGHGDMRPELVDAREILVCPNCGTEEVDPPPRDEW
jgi:hypothetical protein